jgi:hypothetical protein
VTLLLALALLQDPEALIDKLISGELAERDEAVSELVELGPKALPALRKHANHKDAEVKARVLQAIGDIERRERLKSVRPAPVRATVAIKDEPLDKAVEKVMAAYGLKGDATDSGADTKKVSLELKNAPLWAAIEALRRDAGVATGTLVTRLVRTPLRFTSSDAEAPAVFADLGDAGLVVTASKSRKLMTVSIRVMMPPGSRPLSSTADDVVIGAGGKKLTLTRNDFMADEITRRPGCMTAGTVFMGTVPLDEVGDAGELEIEGTLATAWARDVERVDVDIDARETVTKTLGDVEVKVTSITETKGRWKVEYQARPLREGVEADLSWWLEDNDGAWLGDGTPDYLGNATVMTARPAGTPARVVVARMIGRDSVRTPFKFASLKIK